MLAGAIARAATNEIPTKAEQEQMFMEAVMLRQQGFYAEAEPRLKRLAELQPDQPTIRQMLADVQQKLCIQRDDPAYQFKRKLEALVVPEVNFRDADPAKVID